MNIKKIVFENLCHNCGGCVSICAHNAISLSKSEGGLLIPIIDNNLCTECGLCLKVCSGKGFNFENEYNLMFGVQPQDAWLGVYKTLETNYAANEEIRYNSSSGGALTAILLFLLEKGFINGAVVTKFKDNNPLMPDVFLATTKEEILKSAGSKYCPVPGNLVLSSLKQKEGKFAFVGLPCHMQTLRNYLKLDKTLNEKIFITFGLMCSHTNNFNGTKYFLKQKKIMLQDVDSFAYRGNGWIGKIKVVTTNYTHYFNRGGNTPKDKKIYSISFNTSFVPKRCLTCCDHMVEFCDISFGDPRLKEYLNNESKGKSLVVARTKLAIEILDKIYNAGELIKDKTLTPKEFYSGQNIEYKFRYKSHVYLNKLLFKKNPHYIFAKSKKSKLSIGRIIRFLPSYFVPIQKSNFFLQFHYNCVEKFFKPKFYINLIRAKK